MPAALPRYVQRRRRKLYFVIEIPKALRTHYDKPRHIESLKTEDVREAEQRALALAAKWKRDFEQVRRGEATKLDPLLEEARQWAKDRAKADNDDDRDLLAGLLYDRIDRLIEERSRSMGINSTRFALENPDAAVTDLPAAGDKRVKTFAAVATGRSLPLLDHLEDYLAAPTTEMTEKTRDQVRKNVQRLAKVVPTVEELSRKVVQGWVNGMIADEGRAKATIQRALSSCRGYWRWMVDNEIISEEAADPFARINVGNKKSNGSRPKRGERAFEAEEVVKLLEAAQEKGDNQLADLIELARWTGARREELVSLKVENVKLDATVPYVEITDAKTAAGWRQVPIHRKLRPILKRLVKASKDGYVLSGIASDNKYGTRGDAIGKRFSRLKEALGFDSRYVFHSVRKTVITLLANAGVEPVLYKEIVGHETDDVTHKSYYAGATLARKRKAIEKLEYPT